MSTVEPVPVRPAPGKEPSRSPVGRRQKSKARPSPATGQARAAQVGKSAAPPQGDWRLAAVAGAACLAVGIWSYWSTLANLVSVWNREPDYSHGFLVVPLAIAFLFVKRMHYPQGFPGIGVSSPLVGLPLLALALAMRYASGLYYFDFLDGWSILPWTAASVALIGGWRLLLWSLPSIGFLWFMVPLPFGMETTASLPLQRIATKLSCYGLQLLGQPAFAEGNEILLGEQKLLVAEACSGLRLFISVIALAYAYVMLVRRPWWEKGLLVLSVVPIAIVANATRIVVTGLLYQYTTGEIAHWFSHEAAGYAMIPLAGLMFAAAHLYVVRLFPEEEEYDVGALVRQSHI
jgi:exosortase